MCKVKQCKARATYTFMFSTTSKSKLSTIIYMYIACFLISHHHDATILVPGR